MRLSILLAALLAFAFPAGSQQRVWRVGYLTTGDAVAPSLRSATLPVLAEHGFIEGRNLQLVVGLAGGNPERLPALARDIAAAKPDVIIAVSNHSVRAAMSAAPDTPIVMSFAGEDAVAEGLVASLARPGGKVTGIMMLAEEGDLKRLHLVHDALPTVRRFGFLASNTLTPVRDQDLRQAASRLGVELMIRRAGGADEIDGAIALLRADGVGAVVVMSNPLFLTEVGRIAALAIRYRLPTICEWREMAQQGCLLSFGPDLTVLRRRTGEFVVRILKGADPATLPVEQPDRFELVVSLRTATGLGLSLPTAILARANEVIE
jgi:putative ABC transport system substrate-binding protein